MFIRKIARIATTAHHTNICKVSYFFSQMPKMNPNKDYYSILDVTRDADNNQVLAAYDKLKYIYDPSVNPANGEKFNEIEEARLVLTNEKSRKQYDKERFYIKFTDEMKIRYEK
jgi:curved DNA-binding protein CbpA